MYHQLTPPASASGTVCICRCPLPTATYFRSIGCHSHLSLTEYPCFTSLLGSLVYSFGIKRTGPANTVQLCCSIRCSLERMLNHAETALVTLFRMCFNAMCPMCLTRWMAVICHRPAWSFFVYVFMLFHISQWVHQGNALEIMGTPHSCHNLSFTSLSSYTTPFDSWQGRVFG